MAQPVFPEQEYYGTTARHYDPAYESLAPEGDVAFYVDLALRTGGPVLEVACGTGRVLLPTAKAGAAIDGLDFTPQFIGILRQKLARLPAEVQARVSLYEADMRDFAIERRYRLITAPFRPMQHLLTVDDQLRAFACIHRHLEPGGLFAFNVFYPSYERLLDPPAEHEETSWKDPEHPGVTVKRFFRRTSWDRLRQSFEVEMTYRSYDQRGALTGEERSGLRIGYYTYPQLLLLFRAAGFEIVEQYGSFDRKPIDICEEMVFILRKK